MPENSWLSIPWLDAVLKSNWWPLLVVAGYGVLRTLEYLGKRLIEGKPESERIDQYMRLADLQQKLESGKMTIKDLNELRSEALGKKVESAVSVVEQYTSTASRMISQVEFIVHNQNEASVIPGNDTAARAAMVQKRLDNALTQSDMNIASYELFQEAERDLTAALLELASELTPDGAEALHNSQQAWLAYRKFEAEREANIWEGGTIRPLLYNSALEALTRERIALLRRRDLDGEQTAIDGKRRKTPVNILEHVEQGVPRARVEQMLGTPNYVSGNTAYYTFEDTQVEVSFNEGGGVSEVVVALCHGYLYAGSTPGQFTDIPLGRLTLGDLLEVDSSLIVEHRVSVRTAEVFVHGRIGPPGAWTNYCFGALSVFSGAGRLQHTNFEWDYDAGKLRTDPKDILINWMALPSADGAPYFSWFIK
jgi:uncharacterized protein YecT (DUF1311 family)